MIIRTERPGDEAAIAAIHRAAFGGPTEAELVDALRRTVQPLVSLVAMEQEEMVGHILFSPVTLTGHAGLQIMGLAPVGVRPQRQRRGIGSALLREGIEACTRLGFGAVVVLGHADYYPRFGFRPAAEFGIGCQYDVPPEAFMALPLAPGYLDGRPGTIIYSAPFQQL